MDGTVVEGFFHLASEGVQSALVVCRNGAVVEGLVTGIEGDPMTGYVTLARRDAARHEDPRLRVRWAEVSRLVITYAGGSTREFGA